MTKESIRKICEDLELPKGDDFTQDWIYELPEEFRGFDYFKKYFEAYIFNSYDLEVKKVLMNLMLDVTNELIELDDEVGYSAWTSLTYIFAKEGEYYIELIEYWAVRSEPLENSFAITPYVRDL